jgi:hypothetical protein
MALLALVALTALANVRVYDVAPYKCNEGWSAGGNGSYVAQQFVACADTLLYAEDFAGQKPNPPGPNGYLVQVMDGNTPLYEGNATDTLQWAYVRANLSRVNPSVPFIRGKTYLLKVSHTGNPPQPVNYFFDPRETTYTFGEMIVDGAPHEGEDLVCRVVGRMNPVDSLLCGMDDESGLFGESAGARDSWATLARSADVGAIRRYFWWPYMQSDSAWFWFESLDTALTDIVKRAGCEVLASLVGCPRWASTRVDPIVGRDSLYPQYLDTCIHCAPRNLFADTASDTNHWALPAGPHQPY